MSDADLTTFTLQYDAWCSDNLVGMSDVKPFEYFCASQFLKSRALSPKELKSGQVDAGNDGGVDSFYCFLNDVLIDDTLTFDSRAGGTFDIKIIQSKQGKGFSPTAIQKIERFLDDLLSVDRDEADYVYEYHGELLTLVRQFKNVFKELLKRSVPKINIEVFCISKLDVNEPGTNAARAARKLVERARNYYTETSIQPVQFVGARRLWSQLQVAAPKKRFINAEKSFGTAEGWVALVTLNEFFEFLKGSEVSSDGHPILDEQLFDANVRGYQTKSRVNGRITKTLSGGPDLEFWQLNNGITILSSEATASGDRFQIDNPRIVNGLQTSRRVFDFYRTKAAFPEDDKRRILIRVIKSTDEIVRSEIIRATNDQNPMPAEAFLATSRLHHQIETYFAEHDLFYDRRKGYYQAQNTPAIKIVEVVELMQALIAIMERKPDISRGRPRSYLKDALRTKLFGTDETDADEFREPYPLEVYLRVVQIMRRVENYLRGLGLDKPSVRNLTGYVALDITAKLVNGGQHFRPDQIAGIKESQLTDTSLSDSYLHVKKIYRMMGADDSAAKSGKMTEQLSKELKSRYGAAKKKRR